MSDNNTCYTRLTVVVIAAEEEWSSFKSLLGAVPVYKQQQIKSTPMGLNQTCELTMHGHFVRMHCKNLEEMTEEDIKSCTGGDTSFLLMIRGGRYMETDRNRMEVLQKLFGAEVLKHLTILSIENKVVAITLDDALLELIHTCNGKYCRITSSSAGDNMYVLLEMMMDQMLSENTLVEVRRIADTAMEILKEKVQQVKKMENISKEMTVQRDMIRCKELQDLKDEQRQEKKERRPPVERTYSLVEAVRSYREKVPLQRSHSEGAVTKKMSVVLLGLSGSGKTSALNLIADTFAQSSLHGSNHSSSQPTYTCKERLVFAAGRQLVIIDTPELWDEDGSENLNLVKDCLALSLPGPHIFLLVLQVGRFTQGEREMLGHLQRIFGRDFPERAIVLFVHSDVNQLLRPLQGIEDYVCGAHSSLQDFVRTCGSRYYELGMGKSQHALQNPQVKDLLSGMNKLVASHGDRPYAVRRFSTSELQQRKKRMDGRKEGMMEGNYLLRET